MNSPAGADQDSAAPWNEKPPRRIDCTTCDGSGASEEYEEDEEAGQQQLAACTRCHGTGQIEA